MYGFKRIVLSIKDVPDEWIYNHYLNLPEPLDGQNITIHSIFNNENTPSMILYPEGNTYKFKDYSSGKAGNAFDIAQFFEDKNNSLKLNELFTIIQDKYQNYIKNKGEFKVDKDSYKEFDYEWDIKYNIREFNEDDLKYWKQFNISKSILDRFGVVALKSYQLTKVYKSMTKNYSLIQDDYIYAYFHNEKLTTIYQPLNKKFKFLKLTTHIFGEEEICSDVLIIGSSLKDIMSLHSLKLNIDLIAPPSENTIISREKIVELKKKYKFVLTLFDSDEAGIKAMLKYKSLYDIDFVYCCYEKDISDAINRLGSDFIKDYITIQIQKKING